ncbi:putative nucleotidyltransferase substrate binding domain-containing protein [Trichlorobacter ammonificans]|uniref:Predicted signal-transduction protein containing cAMP-binding and CBS domains n=1 Tax=Trichlorobacter ammonificans TaxID=2916410 RepID=A0ABM9D973_9BACT|nr:putative nucleotidyltransferase substrate binding domain-containing protein [Trichlorobacter ammonificans]CAH2030916.1 Predicted signal-transduction protein containing cAMP-binding and CBS domains [Trichlorobacter ammonificans]
MADLNVLFQPVGQYCHREVVTCSPDDPLVEAVSVMRRHNISSLVVCRDGRPMGMISDRDLRNKVVAQGLDPKQLTIADIMHTPLITIGEQEFLFEALHRISRNGIHRLVVLGSQGGLAGIITDSDILRLQGNSPQRLVRTIEEARSVDSLRRLHQRVQGLVLHLIGTGVRVQELVRLIAHLNDQVLVRLIDLLLEEQYADLAGRFAFLVLGSEGRGEQTLTTDQDNALVYADDLTPAEQQRIIEFSETLIQAIIAIGIPPCSGGIMANNPLWRHSLKEWKGVMDGWFAVPTPENILKVGMITDLRALRGNLSLEQAMKDHIAGRLKGNEAYLGHLTSNVLRFAVPLGWFGRIRTEAGEDREGRLDLKKAGIFAITEGVKILAISEGGQVNGTVPRIERLAEIGVLERREADDLIATYHTLVYFRLRTQVEAIREGRTPDNRIALARLNRMEKGRLRTALEGVRSFQGLLQRRFRLGQIL